MTNTRSTFATLGASNHVDHERQKEDFYATDPKAIDILLSVEKFNRNIWEKGFTGTTQLKWVN